MPCIQNLKPIKRKREKINLEQFGYGAEDYVNIKELSAKDLVTLQKKNINDSSVEYAALLVSLATVDDDGKPIFAKPDEVLELDISLIEALSEKIVDLSGIDDKKKSLDKT